MNFFQCIMDFTCKKNSVHHEFYMSKKNKLNTIHIQKKPFHRATWALNWQTPCSPSWSQKEQSKSLRFGRDATSSWTAVRDTFLKKCSIKFNIFKNGFFPQVENALSGKRSENYLLPKMSSCSKLGKVARAASSLSPV